MPAHGCISWVLLPERRTGVLVGLLPVLLAGSFSGLLFGLLLGLLPGHISISSQLENYGGVAITKKSPTPFPLQTPPPYPSPTP